MGERAERPPRRARRRLFIDLTPLRRSADLRWLVIGELISILGTQLTTVAVPYQVYELTHSSLDVGLASLAQLFPLIAGSLLGGSVVSEAWRASPGRCCWPACCPASAISGRRSLWPPKHRPGRARRGEGGLAKGLLVTRVVRVRSYAS